MPASAAHGGSDALGVVVTANEMLLVAEGPVDVAQQIRCPADVAAGQTADDGPVLLDRGALPLGHRSEEHTSELQSQSNLVCRLLLEKKKRYDFNALT